MNKAAIAIGVGLVASLALNGYQAFEQIKQKAATDFYKDRHVTRLEAFSEDINDTVADYKTQQVNLISAERRGDAKAGFDATDRINSLAGHLRFYLSSAGSISSQAIADRFRLGVNDRTLKADEDGMKLALEQVNGKAKRIQAYYVKAKALQPGQADPEWPK